MLQNLGDCYRLLGDHRRARECLERGLGESRERALPYFVTHLLASLAAVDLAEGSVQDALAHAAAAQEAAANDDSPPAAARADLVAGMALQAAGDASAREVLRKAARRHAELGLEADRLECLSVLALALHDAGDLEEALRVVEEVLAGSRDSVVPGVVEPGRTLADAHQVLAAAGDARAAEVAGRAADFLRDRAARIADEELRARYLAAPVSVRLAAVASSVVP
ncbi:hypothetical protein [Blastococcus sp. PRF04-17]|uniref:hypothetical protein n=1 Tax=Blastococcus sp. PRF04-17 TaxID=2933797 RepID=UPI001FF31493|nr:hypothetical protein [Blastococcus sp. PRF04-17]UOY03599.1 hypothetical protein MVA48_09825 [Blastococcus sp. PRF04-17]